jgi:hypothetical protein
MCVCMYVCMYVCVCVVKGRNRTTSEGSTPLPLSTEGKDDSYLTFLKLDTVKFRIIPVYIIAWVFL